MIIQAIAFDCFGTVFDMSNVPTEEVKDYARHVRQEFFSPYIFRDSWRDIPAHADSAVGIMRLQRAGFVCVALSNGSRELIEEISGRNEIQWDTIVDLAKHRVYKPHLDAYRTVEKETGIKPANTCMVTANPSFGDIDGAGQIGMMTMVIRHGFPETILELYEALASFSRRL